MCKKCIRDKTYIALWRLNPMHVNFFVHALPLCAVVELQIVGSKHEFLSTDIVL